MSDTDAVLFANEAFYRAFADRDEASMDDLWASSDQDHVFSWEPSPKSPFRFDSPTYGAEGKSG